MSLVYAPKSETDARLVIASGKIRIVYTFFHLRTWCWFPTTTDHQLVFRVFPFSRAPSWSSSADDSKRTTSSSTWLFAPAADSMESKSMTSGPVTAGAAAAGEVRPCRGAFPAPRLDDTGAAELTAVAGGCPEGEGPGAKAAAGGALAPRVATGKAAAAAAAAAAASSLEAFASCRCSVRRFAFAISFSSACASRPAACRCSHSPATLQPLADRFTSACNSSNTALVTRIPSALKLSIPLSSSRTAACLRLRVLPVVITTAGASACLSFFFRYLFFFAERERWRCCPSSLAASESAAAARPPTSSAFSSLLLFQSTCCMIESKPFFR
mmetsp:Transcript_21595/g.54546  ORF Transcript_21595/g.54546 Transcript_21595/m.54546 type:complete len:327 (-) Transcript_21595:604-1584(-)